MTNTKLPCDECKGKCCQFPAMTMKEFLLLKMAKPLPKNAKVAKIPTGVVLIGECPYLENGKCSVWNVRPKVCRMYGEVEKLPCAYLYPDKVKNEIDKIMRLK